MNIHDLVMTWLKEEFSYLDFSTGHDVLNRWDVIFLQTKYNSYVVGILGFAYNLPAIDVITMDREKAKLRAIDYYKQPIDLMEYDPVSLIFAEVAVELFAREPDQAAMFHTVRSKNFADPDFFQWLKNKLKEMTRYHLNTVTSNYYGTNVRNASQC